MKCPFCQAKIKYKKEMIQHIGLKHKTQLPEGMSPAKFLYSSKHGGMTTGTCRVCKNETVFNEQIGIPRIFCEDPKCKETFAKLAKDRMIKVYGKESLLGDQNHQMYMLSKRKISGTYHWSDHRHTNDYVGTYELKWLEFLDHFLNWDPATVHMPCPIVIPYQFDGATHLHSPDCYLDIIDCIVEIKHGGNNPNLHPKIQAVDVAKDKAKEEAIRKSGHNYIKLTDNNFNPFLKAMFNYVENLDEGNRQRIFIINESSEDETHEQVGDYELYVTFFFNPDNKVGLNETTLIHFHPSLREGGYIHENNQWNTASFHDIRKSHKNDKVITMKYMGETNIQSDIQRFQTIVNQPLQESVVESLQSSMSGIFKHKNLQESSDIILSHDFEMIKYKGGIFQ